MAKETRKKKQIRLQDFEKNAEGKYEYRGTMYRFSGDFVAFSIRGWTLVGIIVVAVLSGGILPATGAMDTWYVLIPYGVTIGAAGFCCYRMIQWCSGKGWMREYNYQKSIKGFPGAVKVLIGASGITFFSEVVYLVTNGLGEYPAGAVILMVTMVITLISGIMLERLVSLQFWEKQGA